MPLPSEDIDDLLSHTTAHQKPAIYFDLRRHPRYIRLSSANRSIPADSLHNPVCRPKLCKLTIHHPNLFWELRLQGKDVYVTVQEVLDGLYTFLQTPVTEVEWDHIRRGDPARARRIEEAAQYRRETPAEDRRLEESIRRKRVDVLEADFIFGGLQWEGDGVLSLKTSRA